MDQIEASPPSLGITPPRFENDKLRDVQLKVLPMPFPPVTRELLMRQSHDVPAWPIRDIADHAGVEIRSRAHDATVSQLVSNRKMGGSRTRRVDGRPVD